MNGLNWLDFAKKMKPLGSFIKTVAVSLVSVPAPRPAQAKSIAHWLTPGGVSPAVTTNVLPKGSKINLEVLEASGYVPEVVVRTDRPVGVIKSGIWKTGETILVDLPNEAKVSIQGKSPFDNCVISGGERNGGYEMLLARVSDAKSFIRLWVLVAGNDPAPGPPIAPSNGELPPVVRTATGKRVLKVSARDPAVAVSDETHKIIEFPSDFDHCNTNHISAKQEVAVLNWGCFWDDIALLAFEWTEDAEKKVPVAKCVSVVKFKPDDGHAHIEEIMDLPTGVLVKISTGTHHRPGTGLGDILNTFFWSRRDNHWDAASAPLAADFPNPTIRLKKGQWVELWNEPRHRYKAYLYPSP